MGGKVWVVRAEAAVPAWELWLVVRVHGGAEGAAVSAVAAGEEVELVCAGRGGCAGAVVMLTSGMSTSGRPPVLVTEGGGGELAEGGVRKGPAGWAVGKEGGGIVAE